MLSRYYANTQVIYWNKIKTNVSKGGISHAYIPMHAEQ